MLYATWKIEGHDLIKAGCLDEELEREEGAKDDSTFLTWVALRCRLLGRADWGPRKFEYGEDELNLGWVECVVSMGHLHVDQQVAEYSRLKLEWEVGWGLGLKNVFFKSIRWVRLEYFYRLEGTYQWWGEVFRGWAQRDCSPWAGKGGGMTGKNRCLRRCVGWSLRTFSLLASNFVNEEARPMKA